MLPADLDARVMDLSSDDRHHAKQGRSTARFRFDGPDERLSVYLKRHDRLPLSARLGAWLRPGRGHSPGSAEWAHLERVRALGIAVPEVVAVGERIGPWGRLQSYLMVAELVGQEELHVAIPRLAAIMGRAEFTRLKRQLIAEMARVAVGLHRERLFHKDLYLCHFFVDPIAAEGRRLTLIDLHRLARHRWLASRWRRKDLAQLLYSTVGVDGIDDRDRLRFWKHYRRAMGLRWPRRELRAVRRKAGRYLDHNR
jgi:heptose I phosphotransferase